MIAGSYGSSRAFLVAQLLKNPPALQGDPGSIPGSGRFPGEGHGNLLQYSCLEHCYGQRSPAGYSPWDRKESDTTEQLSTAQHMVVLFLIF